MTDTAPGKRASVLVVDDEPLARRRLVRLLERRSDIVIAGECRNGREAVTAIRNDPPDILFLDVQMADLDGVGVLEEVGIDAVGAVIFVTAYDRYALTAFDLHAVDYLLKPFSDDRFQRSLERALGRLQRCAAVSLSDSVLAAVAGYREHQRTGGDAREGIDRLRIRSAGRTRFIATAEIDWLEAAGSYVRIHTAGRPVLIRETLSRLAEQLPAEFIRIHRSTIVHLDRVVEVRNLTHREFTVVLVDGTELKLSRTYRRSAGRRLGLED